jgi:hypothetical protein
MTHKDFTNWLTGYLDGINDYVLNNEQVCLIQNKLNSIKDDEILHSSPQITIPPMPFTTDDNPYTHIICDAKEPIKGSADPDIDNVYKDELI